MLCHQRGIFLKGYIILGWCHQRARLLQRYIIIGLYYHKGYIRAVLSQFYYADYIYFVNIKNALTNNNWYYILMSIMADIKAYAAM